jgi:hypothetical protein
VWPMQKNNIKINKSFEDLFDIDQANIKKYKDGLFDLLSLKEKQNKLFCLLKDLVANHGFPFLDTSSEKAYKAAFLIVLHSSDIFFMKKVLDIFYIAKGNQINITDIAFLEDKLRVVQGLPQIFGTQYFSRGMEVVFYEIEDENNVDTRRKKMKLESLFLYKHKIENK